MGIKGIYRELGPGQRVSLAKLATENLEKKEQPLRIAIDIAIWQFQTQAAKGGTNPAIRTLFYRLIRLLGLAVQPIFVFDGPNKPVFKRNKRSGRGDGIASAMAKRLIHLFGFPVHQAPGEAEAECALMQQQGLVDAVLSEDVDTIMFGCGRTLRNWTAEGSRGGKSPTHVTVYDVNEPSVLASGLDREGMVLVALMSGGDYLPEGVPGCGVKLACEVARAGFGKTLCSIKTADKAAMAEWRATLVRELRTNERNFFRTKHKALVIPDSFPDLKILRYYTHPAVSSKDSIQDLSNSIEWSKPVDVVGLRQFVLETFDWTYRPGAVKLIRVLSPSLLVQKLLKRYDYSTQAPGSHGLELTEHDELALVQRIVARRSHFSMDGIPELRISHVPADIVLLDLSQECDEIVDMGRQGLALNSDDEFEMTVPNSVVVGKDSPVPKKTFDPSIPQQVWLPETLVRLGVPLCVQDWEEKQRAKTSASGTSKPAKKRSAKIPASKVGALDQWVVSTKPTTRGPQEQCAAPTRILRNEGHFKIPQSLPPSLASPRSRSLQQQTIPKSRQSPTRTLASLPRSKPFTSKSAGNTTAGTTRLSNPWAFSGSQHTPRTTKPDKQSETSLVPSSPEGPEGLPIPLDVGGRSLKSGVRSKGEQCRAHEASSSSSEGSFGKVQCDASSKCRIASFATELELRREKRAELIQTSMALSVSKSVTSSTQPARSSTPQEDHGTGEEHRLVDTTPPSASSGLSASNLSGRIKSSSPRRQRSSQVHARSLSPTPRGQHAGSREGAVAFKPRLAKTTTVIVPRNSAFGFFKEVDMSCEEAAQLIASETEQDVGCIQKASTRHGGWRQSQVAVIDLTGED